MRRITIARAAISVVATPFLVILFLNIEKLAEKHGLDLLLTNAIEGKMIEALTPLVLHPAMLFTAVAVVAFTFGIWIDAWMRHALPERSAKDRKLRQLGDDAVQLAEDIMGFMRSDGPRSFDDHTDIALTYSARYIPIRYALRAMKIERPNMPPEATLDMRLGQAAGYLHYVGQLLREGNLKAARLTAKRILKAASPTIEAHVHQRQQDTVRKTQP